MGLMGIMRLRKQDSKPSSKKVGSKKYESNETDSAILYMFNGQEIHKSHNKYSIEAPG